MIKKGFKNSDFMTYAIYIYIYIYNSNIFKLFQTTRGNQSLYLYRRKYYRKLLAGAGPIEFVSLSPEGIGYLKLKLHKQSLKKLKSICTITRTVSVPEKLWSAVYFPNLTTVEHGHPKIKKSSSAFFFPSDSLLIPFYF